MLLEEKSRGCEGNDRSLSSLERVLAPLPLRKKEVSARDLYWGWCCVDTYTEGRRGLGVILCPSERVGRGDVFSP